MVKIKPLREFFIISILGPVNLKF